MPVFVAAAKSKRGRRRNRGAPPQGVDDDVRGSSGRSGSDASLQREEPLGGPPSSEAVVIKDNLRKFFDSEKEEGIASKTSKSCVLCPVEMDGEARTTPVAYQEPPVSPVSPSPNGGQPLVPCGVEKSFKSRRSFSKLHEV